MRKRSIILAGAVSAALAGALAWAQPISLLNLTGNEIMQASIGIGGTGIFVPVYVLRNASGYQVVATGGTVNTTVANTVSKLVASGAITTWNITLPTAPFDGQMVEVSCPGGTATASVSATLPSGVTIVGTAFTACTAGGAAANTAEWIYSTAANVWYRIQ